jgi:alkylated DNA repair dioxygenase AlkB
MLQEQLFDSQWHGPEGFVYQPGFITQQEETVLLQAIEKLPLQEAHYKQFIAKRRTLSYGAQYDFGSNTLSSAPALPEFLMPLREKVAHWAGVPAADFQHALITEYRPGTPLGWHRDVPNFEVIVGVSLRGACRMRLRPYRPGERNRKEDVIMLELQPRSSYQIRDTARWSWQHSIVATEQQRYSITFRTARSPLKK